MASLTPNLRVMINAAEKAGRSLARDFGEVEQLQVSKKGPKDFVSAADTRAEEIIHYNLSKDRPDHGFLMEERGAVDPENPRRFIVDPLDGTINFLHGLPLWCVSIGLEEHGKVIAGVIHNPILGETYYAERGLGAFSGKKRLRVSGRKNMEECIISCPNIGHPDDDTKAHALKIANMADISGGIRVINSTALELAYLAAGRIDGMWSPYASAWDVAAGIIILKESGGYVSKIDGKQNNMLEGQGVIGGNEQTHKALLSLLKKG